MTLPNFLIIGAQKSGTTWLFKTLANHPDVFMPRREVNFFEKPENRALGLEWYQEHFKGATQESAIGEKTPTYLCVNQQASHETQRYIYEYSPDIKLIAVLRDPVERAISHARHYMRQAKIGGDISPFMKLDHIIFNSFLSESILARGYYAQQLEAYYEYFKPEQILVVINEEEIIKDPKTLMVKVCNFLNIDPAFEFKNIEQTIHDGSFSRAGVVLGSLFPSMKREIRYLDRSTLAKKFSLSVNGKTLQKLYDHYHEENERLFALLNHRWSSWSMPG